MWSTSGLFHSLNHVWETGRVSAIRIETLSALVAVILSFLVLFGSWRRWSTHWFIQKGVMVAYILSFSLVTYTIGLMQSATVKVDVYPIWAVCFLTVFGCTNSITAYSLEDNYQVSRQLVQCALYTVYVLLILFSVADGVSFTAVFLMLVITLVKVYLRAVASMNVTGGSLSSKRFADYMDADSDQDYDPVSMKGYRYLISCNYVGHSRGAGGAPNLSFKAPNYSVEFAPFDFDVITIEKIWQECDDKDNMPVSSSVSACKDICLSYSLFTLLIMRFSGYNCGESTQQKTHDFVFKGLLRVTDNGVNSRRVFEVIEIELALLYDNFFTKYATLDTRLMTTWCIASVASLLSVIALTIMRATGIIPIDSGNASRVLVAKATYADNTITIIILAALALLEVVQMLLYWTSNWGRVAFVCQYIRQPPSSRRNPSCSMRLKAFLSRVKCFSTRKYYWKHQIGQYSLLQSVGRSNPCACLARAVNICCKIPKIVGLPFVSLTAWTVSTEAEHVDLSADVKEAVILSLIRTGGRLRNGASLLASNGAGHLLWACLQGIRSSAAAKGTQTRTILTWHIATCYCEMARVDEPLDCQLPKKVATALSRYCAYLIIHAPQLLPGHKVETSCLFNAAGREAAKYLKDNEGNKYQALRNLEGSEDTIFGSGVKLGKQLEQIQDVAHRWKVLADFWSEMLLYIAPSDKIKEHIEQLAQGGEFITHLWALLSHAGIFKPEELHHDAAV